MTVTVGGWYMTVNNWQFFAVIIMTAYLWMMRVVTTDYINTSHLTVDSSFLILCISNNTIIALCLILLANLELVPWTWIALHLEIYEYNKHKTRLDNKNYSIIHWCLWVMRIVTTDGSDSWQLTNDGWQLTVYGWQLSVDS